MEMVSQLGGIRSLRSYVTLTSSFLQETLNCGASRADP